MEIYFYFLFDSMIYRQENCVNYVNMYNDIEITEMIKNINNPLHAVHELQHLFLHYNLRYDLGCFHP